MPDYRRNRVPGGTYFFTVNLRDRASNLLTTHIAELREALRATRARAPFHVDAWVVLPDHMHAIWTRPEGDVDYPGRWRELKKSLSRAIPPQPIPSSLHLRPRDYGIWQRRYWEHTIRDDRDYAAHMDYVHFNPVKHGHVPHPADWPYSTFKHAVAAGLYPLDWANPTTEPGNTGEAASPPT